MKSGPLISVLLPARNAGPFIDDALRSVFTQTLQDFEIIAVDDGSVDDTTARLEAWARRDTRLRIFRLGGVGPAGALNAAIAVARGEFFARMDADDISHRLRFEAQLTLLKERPEVGVCGSWVRPFGMGWERAWRYPEDSGALRARLLFGSPFAHPATMIRRAALERLPLAYREDVARAEDYDLWVRLSEVCEFACLQHVLLHYRRHASQVTVSNLDASIEGARQVRGHILAKWWPECTEQEQAFHDAVCANLLPTTLENLHLAESWFKRILLRNRDHPFASQESMQRAVVLQWYDVCRRSGRLGLGMLRVFHHSSLTHSERVGGLRWMRVVLSAFIRHRVR